MKIKNSKKPEKVQQNNEKRFNYFSEQVNYSMEAIKLIKFNQLPYKASHSFCKFNMLDLIQHWKVLEDILVVKFL